MHYINIVYILYYTYIYLHISIYIYTVYLYISIVCNMRVKLLNIVHSECVDTLQVQLCAEVSLFLIPIHLSDHK